jgi:predicted PurR-regulated permease PerM
VTAGRGRLSSQRRGQAPGILEIDEPTTAPRDASAVPLFLEVAARWAWRLIVVGVALFLVLWLAARLRLVVVPLILAIVLVAVLSPAVELLARKLPRLAATWAVILAVLLLTVGIGYLVVSPLADQFQGLGDDLNSAIDDGKDWLRTGPIGLSEDRVEDLDQTVRDQVEATVTDRPLARLARTVEVLTGGLLALVLAFFFLKDGPSIWQWFLDRVRPERRAAVDAAGSAAFSSVQHWVRGVAITGLVEAVLIGGTLLVLGVPAVLPVAILTFFAAFFPVVGATVAGVIAAVVALVTNGVGDALIVAVAVLAVQQIEGHILMPLIMRRQVKLHPAVVLLALATGAAVGGILGALLAVPLTAGATAAIAAAKRVGAESTS